eukprot:TRINITY_DN76952_c0_g1_i1.p1 TRINITY_DN76952_c0_g1~~TRINITY_DN76952_c0_g1_i1.p1  ORF type:complete len:441 (+),score=84.86 TRINITY_DN76952_c0_g1_i1:120-1325(+)
MAKSVSGSPSDVSEKDFEFSKCLGRGYFGEVWKATAVADNSRIFAVKKVRLQLIKENRFMDQLQREINILYSLDHPKIVKLFHDFTDDDTIYLAMEFVGGGSLFERLTDAGKVKPQQSARYFYETCAALNYIHTLPEKVIHRDIKPENILLDSHDGIKLADFGWANMLNADVRQTFCGTLDYLPPEMILGKGHDESVDMWNMGVLLYELTTGKSPFGSPSKEKTCRLIIAVDLQFSDDFDELSKDLIMSLLKKNPKERLTAAEAMRHSFIKEYHHVEADIDGVEEDKEDHGIDMRPSVLRRALQKECTQLGIEKKHLVGAKQQLEKSLMDASREYAETVESLRAEVKRREAVEEACAEKAKMNEEREREIEALRKKQASLEAELKQGTHRHGWFSRLKGGN